MFKIRLWFYWMVAGVVLIGTIMWLSYWGTQVSQDWVTLQQNPTDASKKKFDASLEIAKAIVAGVGTVATIGGGFFVLWNIRLTQTRLITERFSKAVEQLGSDKIEVRLGGIYALERIAQDSDRDHWTIMEVLTPFIQEKTSMKLITGEKIRARADEIEQQDSEVDSSQVGTDEQNRDSAIRELTADLMNKDIQAALTVIGRRKHKKDPPDKRLDLSGTNLVRANLRRAHLDSADLRRANLLESDFSDAYLNNADLGRANLNFTIVRNAHLDSARLNGTNCSDADLSGANLFKTNFRGADLSDADLSGANLSESHLSHANLSGAIFYRANLLSAIFLGANFRGADLSGARNLTAEQLVTPKLCQTKLPEGIDLNPNRDCEALGF